MSNKLTEALVIGGGPAGCSAAIRLAQLGVQTRLCEARAYPHPKVCGEFLSLECDGLLRELGLGALLAEQGAVPIRVACLTAPDGAAWETRLPGTAWSLSRHSLDAALARQASRQGVDVREGTTVLRVSGDLERGFELETRTSTGAVETVRARFVVAAHGKRGALDRTLRRAFLSRPQPFLALKAHFRGPSLSDRIELHAFPGGYCGLSNVENGLANVCLLVHERIFRAVLPPNSPGLLAFVTWMRSQNAHLDHWLSRAKPVDAHWLSIGQVPFVQKRAVVNDVLMAGDSAGLIAPLAGDGIAMALQAGLLAAGYGAEYLRRELSARELRRCYADAWRREFAWRLRLGRVLQACMLRPRLISLALRVIALIPALGGYLIRQTRTMERREALR
jgi:flavin-dependent dehydrogenase